jgi:CSLREA domain-containing protein
VIIKKLLFYTTLLVTMISVPGLCNNSGATKRLGVAIHDTQIAFDSSSERISVSMADADFNEDGVRDLVIGYATSSEEGLLVIRVGSLSSIYPNSNRLRNKPGESGYSDSGLFGFSTSTMMLPEAPDFVVAGDFNADGHEDVVAAGRGGNRLHFLRGNGTGDLSPSEDVKLPGRMVDLLSGEVNRADGLPDVVAAVQDGSGTKIMVFESPGGAMETEGPEVFPFSSDVSSLELGRIDSDYFRDLAVAEGKELIVIYGRDRKLSLNEESRKQVPPPSVQKYVLPSEILSLTIGHFSGPDPIPVDPNAEIVPDTGHHPEQVAMLLQSGSLYLLDCDKAFLREVSMGKGVVSGGTKLLRAKVSASTFDDMLVLDSKDGTLDLSYRSRAQEVFGRFPFPSSGTPSDIVAIIPLRLNSDALDDFVVLREGSAVSAIMTAPLATFTVNSTVDPGNGVCDAAQCTLREALTAANSSPGLDSIVFNIAGAGPYTINLQSGLSVFGPEAAVMIDGTSQPGYAGTPIIELNGGGLPLSVNVITVSAGSSVLRGLVINHGPQYGIVLTSLGGNVVEENFVGTDMTGGVDYGNAKGGVYVNSPNNIVGGTVQESRNLISGNDKEGLRIASTGTIVENNFIGTNSAGTTAIANQGGILITSSGNTIGGTTAGSGNVISGNGSRGVTLQTTSATLNLIQGNLIGTTANGLAALGNATDGIINYGPGGSNNTIGGTTPAARNIISGNLQYGIEFNNPLTGNIVQGNFIGTDVSGAYAIGNYDGVIFGSAPSDNTVGGTVAGAGNVISGNLRYGVLMSASNGNRIQGNFIGTDLTGTLDLGNVSTGIAVSFSSTDTLIGGTTIGSGNLISGNNWHGIELSGTASSTMIVGNLIGTKQDGTSPLGNGRSGISITSGTGTIVGGASGANRIASNGLDGISVISGTGNRLQYNSIYSNGDLGIDLGSSGVQANDSGDGDTGPNNLQNYPVVSSASSCGGVNTIVQGTINTTASSNVSLDFFSNSSCDTSGYGEGATYIGSAPVVTDAVGNASFSLSLPVVVADGQSITATAINSSGDTSEFSQCRRNTGVLGEVIPPLSWCPGTKNCLQWPVLTGSSSYAVYRGTAGDLPSLVNANTDSCLSWSGVGNSTVSITDTPPPGSLYWYIVRPINSCGEGSAGSTSEGPRIQNSTGPCL